MTDRNY